MSETSIGQKLKHARTARKLTLKQVTKAIHIREEYLAAIEKDQLEGLPSPVQGRGFIRLYWSYLGLDEYELDEILRPIAPPLAEILVEAATPPAKKNLLLTNLSNRLKAIMVVEAPTAMESTSTEDIHPVEPVVEPISPEPANPSDQVIQQIGDQLRDQRNRLSLTLADIETYTHIPAHYLRALEDGHLDQLPSPVQGRGMLSNYAGFLDMDVDALLMQYADSLQLRREEQDLASKQKKGKRKPPKIVKSITNRVVFSLDVALVAVLVLVAFGALIWGAGNILAYRSSTDELSTAPPISEVIINTSETTPESSFTPTGGISTTEPPGGEVVAPPMEITPTEQITGSVTVTTINQSMYPVQVFIVAVQRSYLQAIVDGKVVFNGRTIPGNPYIYNGEKQVEIISGNAAAIQVTYNGQNMGSLGVNGAVIHLIFGENEYGTPTQTPTATYTETLRPSRTPRPSNTYPPTRTKTNTATKLPTSTPKPTNTPKGTINP